MSEQQHPATRRADSVGIWWTVAGPGGVLATVLSIVANFFEPIARYGWAAVVLFGVASACLILFLLAVSLALWRYFRPLDGQPGDAAEIGRQLEILRSRLDRCQADVVAPLRAVEAVDTEMQKLRAEVTEKFADIETRSCESTEQISTAKGELSLLAARVDHIIRIGREAIKAEYFIPVVDQFLDDLKPELKRKPRRIDEPYVVHRKESTDHFGEIQNRINVFRTRLAEHFDENEIGQLVGHNNLEQLERTRDVVSALREGDEVFWKTPQAKFAWFAHMDRVQGTIARMERLKSLLAQKMNIPSQLGAIS